MNTFAKTLALLVAALTAESTWASAADAARKTQIEARKELASVGVAFSAAALVDAVRNRDSLALSLLLDAGVEVNTPVGGQTALMVAVESGASQMVRDLIEVGADVSATDSHGNTVIHAARNEESVGLLVERGASVNALNALGETALWRSVAKLRNRGLAEALLDAGARPDLAPLYESTELAYALESRDVELVRMLAAHGADVDAYVHGTWLGEPNPNWDSLARGIPRGEEPPPGTPTVWEGSLLFKAVYDNNIGMATLLLDLGASPDRTAWNHDKESQKTQYIDGKSTTYKFTYSSKSSPFVLAVQQGQVTLAERMLVSGAEANSIFHDRFEFPNGEVTSDSYSPLSKGVPTGDAELVALLLKNGADVNAVPCLLQQSAAQASLGVLRLLIEGGVEVNAPCAKEFGWGGRTALEVAVQQPPPGKWPTDAWTAGEHNAKREIVEALVNGGADVNKSTGNQTPLIHWAVRWKFGTDPQNLRLLIELGANVNTLDSEGHTPLHTAVHGWNVDNRVAKMEVLVDACVDLEVRSSGGKTALEMARDLRSQSQEAYDLLRQAKRRQKQIGC